MNRIVRKSWLVLAMVGLAITGCRTDGVKSDYNPNEFTLMVAASNNGEVGPCG